MGLGKSALAGGVDAYEEMATKKRWNYSAVEMRIGVYYRLRGRDETPILIQSCVWMWANCPTLRLGSRR